MNPACPSCDAAVEPGQDYCLSCGVQLEPPRKRGRVPVWVWASLASLAIAAGGAAAAIAATRGEDGARERTIVALSRLRKAPSPATPARRKQRVATPAKARRGLISWPDRSGYTIVLASLPLRRGVGPAKAIAERALRRGLANVGVLDSTGYAGLHPGYYVVFAGVYESVEEAQGKLPTVAASFPAAYARQITH